MSQFCSAASSVHSVLRCRQITTVAHTRRYVHVDTQHSAFVSRLLLTFCGTRLSSSLCAPSVVLHANRRSSSDVRATKHKYASATHSPSTAAVPSTASATTLHSPSAQTESSPLQQPAQQPAHGSSEADERPRRRYASPSADTDRQVQQLKRELLQTRLRLAKTEETHSALYEGVLAKLDETDRMALQTASSLRYTGMALRCAHDNLEVELRRLLTIGLTAGDVDAAAIEAGARQYVRQNIGFHAGHVATEPSAVTDVAKVSRAREREDAKR
jgi:hypothetical protein